jgi:DNA processing protein
VPLQHYLQLSLTSGLGPITIGRLVNAFGSAERACTASVNELQSVDGIGATKARTIHAGLRSAQPAFERELKRAAQLGVTLICPEDDAYPPLLKHIPDPPAVLYVRGGFEPRDLNGLAIVGSRKCGMYGREQAERFAALLAGAGFTVLSGGARGIDTCAHRGALAQPLGRTIAVLGSGLDVPYPAENKPLFDQIAAGRGVVVSEYPIGTPPVPENFPRRNRIVSGMSRGVLVVEADERSGALITARQCIEDHNRPVFAVPGRVDNPLSAGPHKLIREGAVLTTGLDDILDNLDPLPHDLQLPATQATASAPPSPFSEIPSTPEIGLTDRQRAILLHLSTDPTGVDRLIELTSLSAALVMQELTLLSLKGLVRRVDGQTYVRRPKSPA